MKSCIMLAASLFAKVPLLGEITKGKQDYFSLLKTAKALSSAGAILKNRNNDKMLPVDDMLSYVINPTRIIVFQI